MSSNNQKIVILDFVDDSVYILDYDHNIYHNVEDFFLTEKIIEAGISINNCEFMIVSSNRLALKFAV